MSSGDPERRAPGRLGQYSAVTEESNPRFYRLLEAFRKITGLGVLLNTSLNRCGMPIVETPEQAIQFYLGTKLDILVIGDSLIRKITPEPAAQADIRRCWTRSRPR